MLACAETCAPVAWPAHGMQLVAGVDGDLAGAVDDPDLAHRGQLVGAEQRRAAPSRRESPAASRSSPCGPWAGSTTDCVATAPMPGPRPDAQRADREPVRVHGGAVLAGLGVEGDDRVRAVPHGARRYPDERARAGRPAPDPRHPAGLRPRLRRRLPRRAALRRRGALRLRRPERALAPDRAGRRIACEGRAPAPPAGGRGRAVPRRAGGHADRGCPDLQARLNPVRRAADGTTMARARAKSPWPTCSAPERTPPSSGSPAWPRRCSTRRWRW